MSGFNEMIYGVGGVDPVPTPDLTHGLKHVIKGWAGWEGYGIVITHLLMISGWVVVV